MIANFLTSTLRNVRILRSEFEGVSKSRTMHHSRERCRLRFDNNRDRKGANFSWYENRQSRSSSGTFIRNIYFALQNDFRLPDATPHGQE